MDSGMRLDIGSSEQHQRSAGGRMTRCAARGTKHSDRPADLCACIPTGSGELVPVDGLCHSRISVWLTAWAVLSNELHSMPSTYLRKVHLQPTVATLVAHAEVALLKEAHSRRPAKQ